MANQACMTEDLSFLPPLCRLLGLGSMQAPGFKE